MLLPKSRPRYLPTLTHVVTAAELLPSANDMDAVSNSVVSTEHSSNLQELVDVVIPRVVAQMREELQANLEIQLHQFESKIRVEVESMVRDAVNGCVAFPKK